MTEEKTQSDLVNMNLATEQMLIIQDICRFYYYFEKLLIFWAPHESRARKKVPLVSQWHAYAWKMSVFLLSSLMIYSNCFLKYFNGAAEKAQCMKSLPCHPKDLSAITAHVENSENGGICLSPQPWGGGDRRTRGSYWPASLANLSGSRPVRNSAPNQGRWSPGSDNWV